MPFFERFLFSAGETGPYTRVGRTTAAGGLSAETVPVTLATKVIRVTRRYVNVAPSSPAPPPPVNLNSVTWAPDNLLVDYDIGGGTVQATMAQFNLVDPTLVVAFAIENQGLDSIINLDELVNLEELRLSGNDLVEIIAIPDSVTLLDLSNNDITGVGIPASWPTSLEELFIANNSIGTLLATFPTTMIVIDISNCDIAGLAGLGLEAIVGLVNLNFSNNLLAGLPDLPENTVVLNVSNNDFSGGGIAFVFANGGGSQLTTVNATDCAMPSFDSATLVNAVAITAQSNGTLSMLGNSAPNGTEPALTALLDDGWTLTFPTLDIPAPVDGVVGGTSLTTLDANWDWPPPATSGRLASITGYQIRWGTSPGVYTLGNATVSNVTLTYQITGLSDSTTYYIVVRAVAPGDQFYAAGNGPDCTEFEGTTDAP